jgi:hypothetical protein
MLSGRLLEIRGLQPAENRSLTHSVLHPEHRKEYKREGQRCDGISFFGCHAGAREMQDLENEREWMSFFPRV